MTQAARQESVVGEISTILGRGSEFEGKLTFEGSVQIDGVLKGEVFSEDVLIIGEGARVEAEIDVGAITIRGTVIGNIRAKRSIEVLAPGRVNGDLTTPILQIEKGVVFEGRSLMETFESKTNMAKSGNVKSEAPKKAPNGPKPVK